MQSLRAFLKRLDLSSEPLGWARWLRRAAPGGGVETTRYLG